MFVQWSSVFRLVQGSDSVTPSRQRVTGNTQVTVAQALVPWLGRRSIGGSSSFVCCWIWTYLASLIVRVLFPTINFQYYRFPRTTFSVTSSYYLFEYYLPGGWLSWKAQILITSGIIWALVCDTIIALLVVHRYQGGPKWQWVVLSFI